VKTGRVLVEGRILEVEVAAEGSLRAGGTRYQPDAVTFLPPLQPRTLYGLALNYADHAAELELERPEDPAIFIKALSSLVGHRGAVVYPRGAQYCHYEAELAVVIGRTARRVKAKDALWYVSGYTVANDFTCRDFVKNVFRPPVKAKGFDSFGPLGPYVVSADEVGDPGNLRVTTHVNGELRQEGSTRDLILSVPDIIEYFSWFLTLAPGDIILTGTPKGISHVYPGDEMACAVEGVGCLVNRVVEEPMEVGA
jgi:5-oxopent-3-ene-1,2,5-tricarboxylate decarboxylase/2-hydroxyhepta-2,4-diene-1,7-dioate isomerase